MHVIEVTKRKLDPKYEHSALYELNQPVPAPSPRPYSSNRNTDKYFPMKYCSPRLKLVNLAEFKSQLGHQPWPLSGLLAKTEIGPLTRGFRASRSTHPNMDILLNHD